MSGSAGPRSPTVPSQSSCHCSWWGRLTCADTSHADVRMREHLGNRLLHCQTVCCDAFHRCPLGSYLSAAIHRKRSIELQSWQRARRAQGWSPLPWQKRGSNFEMSGVSTYCSANYVKPPQCRSDRWATLGDRIPHYKMMSGRVGAPLRSVHGSTVEMVHNYKAAGTALRDYLTCQYGEDGDTEHELSVFAVRDPIDRFVSSVAEVLQRTVNNVCPDGPCQNNPDNMRGNEWSRNAEWYQLATRNDFKLTPDLLPELMAAFVSDVSCCRPFRSADHFGPQATFATYAQRGIDMLIRVTAMRVRLDALARRSGLTSRNCSLESLNVASSKPSNVPSASALRGALNSSLIRQLCDIYSQDYVCFGMQRPAICEDSAASAKPATPVGQVERSTAPPAAPLVSVLVLTCNRRTFAAMTVWMLSMQNFAIEQIEAVLIDDGPEPVDSTLLQQAVADSHVEEVSALLRDDGASVNLSRVAVRCSPACCRRTGHETLPTACLAVRLVRLNQRASIGVKRNVGVRAARGEVVLHWDDDDMHHPDRIEAQAGPILRNETDLTTLSYSWSAEVARNGHAAFFKVKKTSHVPFPGSLAYRRSIALVRPFANRSLCEDIRFAENAVTACLSHLVVALPSVYTRHSQNTWNWSSNAKLHTALSLERTHAPSFVTASVKAWLERATADLQRNQARGSTCAVVNHAPPEDFDVKNVNFPNLPPRCCVGHASRPGCKPRSRPRSASRKIHQHEQRASEVGPEGSDGTAQSENQQGGAQSAQNSCWELERERLSDECLQCDDRRSAWMEANNKVCQTFTHGLRKCGTSEWDCQKYCMLSCARIGRSYPGIKCCNAVSATPERPAAAWMGNPLPSEPASKPSLLRPVATETADASARPSFLGRAATGFVKAFRFVSTGGER